MKTVNLNLVGNTRFLHMLERMLSWTLSVTHIPRKKNRILDALSHYPWAELAGLEYWGAEYPSVENIRG